MTQKNTIKVTTRKARSKGRMKTLDPIGILPALLMMLAFILLDILFYYID